MPVVGRWWQRDGLLRALGIGLGVIGFLAVRHLVGLEHAEPRHQATLGEMGLAAAGFVGFSLGGVLTVLGAHVHDRVEISERWRRRPLDGQEADRLSDDELLARVELRRPGAGGTTRQGRADRG